MYIGLPVFEFKLLKPLLFEAVLELEFELVFVFQFKLFVLELELNRQFPLFKVYPSTQLKQFPFI
jgi:hypothetical protein